MTKKENGHTLLNPLLKQKCFQRMASAQQMFDKTPAEFILCYE